MIDLIKDVFVALFKFPLRFIELVLSLVLAILVDADTFALAIAGALVGVFVAPWVGVASFLTVWALSRVWGDGATQSAKQINFLARVIRDNRHLAIEHRTAGSPIKVNIDGP